MKKNDFLSLKKVAEGSFKKRKKNLNVPLGCIRHDELRDFGDPKDNPFLDDRGYTPLELDLVDLAYRHTVGDRDMAYAIGQEIYEYFKKLSPEFDNWYESIT